MKVRIGFVSNSSSSSFIVFNDESLIPFDVKYKELNVFEKSLLLREGKIHNVVDRVFLTEFVSDCGCEYTALFGTTEYHSGGHGGPYDEESYTEIAEDVWLYTGKYLDTEAKFTNGKL